MLKTLDKYIEVSGSQRAGLSGFLAGRDRRFGKLLVISVIAHVVFYAAIIKLDNLSLRYRSGRASRRVELVKIAELAPPPDRLPELRRAPDPIERADVSRFHFNPNDADDLNLITRSPRPSTARGGQKLPSSNELERHLKRTRGAGSSVRPASERQSPPSTVAPELGSAPKPEAPLVAETPFKQQATPAPIPPSRSNIPAPVASQTSAGGTRRGDGADSAALGMQQVQAQYLAYVRAKIRLANERIMPRTWIEDVLTGKVSADFEVLLGGRGRIISSQLRRSSGYPKLDDTARDAIYMASPFEGFPPDAGDSITLTVTVYYSPWR